MLTVEYSSERQVVELTCDREGLALLLDNLEWLASQTPLEHFHFFSESWGGGELSEEQQSEDTDLIHHLRVTLLP